MEKVFEVAPTDFAPAAPDEEQSTVRLELLRALMQMAQWGPSAVIRAEFRIRRPGVYEVRFSWDTLHYVRPEDIEKTYPALLELIKAGRVKGVDDHAYAGYFLGVQYRYTGKGDDGYEVVIAGVESFGRWS